MIAIIKSGAAHSQNDLAHLIRNDTDLSSLAAFVRNEVRANLTLQQAFSSIDFHINGPSELPSPSQLLHRMEAYTSPPESESNSGASNFPSNPSEPSISR